jgi:hypothetical protein
MWLSGPITTVHYGHTCQELAAVCRFGVATRRWLSDKSRSAAVVLGNHPISVGPTEHSICEQGILCVLAGLEAVLVRLLRGCMNKQYGIMPKDGCAVLPSLCKADNFPRRIE